MLRLNFRQFAKVMRSRARPLLAGFSLGVIATALLLPRVENKFQHYLSALADSVGPYGRVPAHCRTLENIDGQPIQRIHFSKDCEVHLPFSDPY